MATETTYPKIARNSVNRLRNRADYDAATIHSIIDSSPILHVSFNPPTPAEDPEDHFPTTLPFLGCTGTFAGTSDGKTHIYVHGWVSSRLMRSPAAAAEAGLRGTPVCISATHMDGIVLAMSPFHNSCNYRSAVVHGYANMVTAEDEKLYALELITDNVATGRWANSRQPPTATELKSTTVLRIDIVDASAKIRTGSSGDDRADKKNEELMQRVWTGVVPTWIAYGDPVASGYNAAGEFSDYLKKWVKEKNEENKQAAVLALQEKEKES